MDRRHWSTLVDVAAAVWLVLFAVDVATRLGVLSTGSPWIDVVRLVLGLLLVVFLVDVLLCYRWSAQSPGAFVVDNWFLILTVVPWFRPLRVLRGVRALRALAGIRRGGAAVNKLRGLGERLRQRFFR